MSEPTSPDDPALGPPEHLHPLFLLGGLTGSLRQVAGAYALIGYFLISGRTTYALLGIVALLTFGIIGAIIYWIRFEYRVGADEIRIDRGVVSRTHRSIPFDRIQDVDISQGPLQRILGVARVTFETGGGSAGASEEGALEAISLERAQEIRSLVRSHRSAEPSVRIVEATEEGQAVYALGPARLLLAGTFDFSLAIFAGLVGLTQTVGDAVGFDPFSDRFWRDVLAATGPLQAFVLSHRAVAAAAGALLLILLGLVTGVIRTVLRDYGFRLDRTQAGLRRRRGLLTRTDVTLPVKRAQALVIGTGPVRDLFDWRDLKLQSLAREEDGKSDHLLAPLATDREIASIVSVLGWHALPEEPRWVRVSEAYVWMRLIALSPLFLIFGLQAAATFAAPAMVQEDVRAAVLEIVLPVLVPSLVLLVGLVGAFAVRWLAWHRTCYALDDGRLMTRSGWWKRKILVLPAEKIQSIDLRESFVSRWFGVATLQFGVAGGGLGGHSIPAIPSAKARELRADLLKALT